MDLLEEGTQIFYLKLVKKKNITILTNQKLSNFRTIRKLKH